MMMELSRKLSLLFFAMALEVTALAIWILR